MGQTLATELIPPHPDPPVFATKRPQASWLKQQGLRWLSAYKMVLCLKDGSLPIALFSANSMVLCLQDGSLPLGWFSTYKIFFLPIRWFSAYVMVLCL